MPLFFELKSVIFSTAHTCRQSKRSHMKLITAFIITITLFISTPVIICAEEIIINAVGDIMLAGRWAGKIKKMGYDYPFAAVKNELADGDINIANLESPLARGGSEFTEKKFRFRAEPQVAPAIRKAGFNLVTLANNHSMDFGYGALEETMLNLEKSGIVWIGAGKNLDEARQMVVFKVKGKKVAFLGYSLTQPVEFFAAAGQGGTAPAVAGIYAKDIAAARKEADYVIVSFHWGTEGKHVAHQGQITVAHKAIDAGADVVIGHHPHVLQGLERYKKGIIFYSLGNFVFASSSKTSKTSVIVKLRLSDTVREAEIVPLDVFNKRVNFQPKPLAGEDAAAVIHDMNSYSKSHKTAVEDRNGRYYVKF
jgi:poly-gamma-glutamate capsule biosynthesis protein CapA/YwtB (metallophosphatase superfamily)